MKTKLISYISLLTVLTMGGIACGCNDSLPEKRNERMSKGCITVEEAKSYFEQAMQQVSVTRGGKDDFLIPGDFKPTWSNPTTTTYGNISCMNLPITSFMRYGAKYKQHLRGKDRDKIVDLSQKLIILKNTDTGEMSQYLVTLVPCFGYARAHRGDDIAELFVQGGRQAPILGDGAILDTADGHTVPNRHICQRSSHRVGQLPNQWADAPKRDDEGVDEAGI